MSQQGASAMQTFYRKIELLVILLAAPIVISFIVNYLVPVVGFGAQTTASITYGIGVACTSGGVSYLWTLAAGCAHVASDPAIPSVLMNILEGAIVTIDLIFVAIEGVRIIPAITAIRADQ